MKKRLKLRFPNVKKIMQTNEDVGKIAAATPPLVSKSLELFLQDLCTKTYEATTGSNAKMVTASHLKYCIEKNDTFDFLRSVVAHVPDIVQKARECKKNECKKNDVIGNKPEKGRKRKGSDGEEPKKKCKRKQPPATDETKPKPSAATQHEVESASGSGEDMIDGAGSSPEQHVDVMVQTPSPKSQLPVEASSLELPTLDGISSLIASFDAEDDDYDCEE